MLILLIWFKTSRFEMQASNVFNYIIIVINRILLKIIMIIIMMTQLSTWVTKYYWVTNIACFSFDIIIMILL